MDLNPQFREFLSNIRPTDTQAESWRVGARTLQSRLHDDAELGPQVVGTFLQGSVRRGTAVRPSGDKRPDVDVVVVTRIDAQRTSPADAMGKFEPFLERHYSGKWRAQGRSFGIEMSYVDMDLVITALPLGEAGSAFLERLYKSAAVLSTETLDESADWRLNERWRPQDALSKALGQINESARNDAPSSEWKPHPLFLPDRDAGRWGRTHPLAQIQWTADKNRRCNTHYINVVRALKWWRLQHADSLPRYPKGYPLEHMVGVVVPNGISTMAEGVVAAFEGIRDTWATHAQGHTKPMLADHGVPEHDVLKRLTTEDFLSFYVMASDAAIVARRAWAEQDAQESAKLWRTLFGDRFPVPGPQGGDRKGFSTPAAAAAPPTSGRFA